MQLIRQNTCATCAYRYRDGQELLCRFWPPTGQIVHAPGPMGMQPVGIFPPVKPDWWCGQWKGLVAANLDNGDAPAQAATS